MTNQQTLTAWIKCQLEPVPKSLSQQEWNRWCEAHGFHPLAAPAADQDSRRAWIPSLAQYLRGADYLLYMDEDLISTLDQQDLDNPDVCRLPNPADAPQPPNRHLKRNCIEWYRTSDIDAPFVLLDTVRLGPAGEQIVVIKQYNYDGCQRPLHLVHSTTGDILPGVTVKPVTDKDRPQMGCCPSCKELVYFTPPGT